MSSDILEQKCLTETCIGIQLQKQQRRLYSKADDNAVAKNIAVYTNLKRYCAGVHDTHIGGHELGKNQAEIDGVKYEAGEMDLSGYVGHRVKGYYDDKDLGTYTIVTAEDYKTTVLTIRADDIESYMKIISSDILRTQKREYARTDINLGLFITEDMQTLPQMKCL